MPCLIQAQKVPNLAGDFGRQRRLLLRNFTDGLLWVAAPDDLVQRTVGAAPVLAAEKPHLSCVCRCTRARVCKTSRPFSRDSLRTQNLFGDNQRRRIVDIENTILHS